MPVIIKSWGAFLLGGILSASGIAAVSQSQNTCALAGTAYANVRTAILTGPLAQKITSSGARLNSATPLTAAPAALSPAAATTAPPVPRTSAAGQSAVYAASAAKDSRDNASVSAPALVMETGTLSSLSASPPLWKSDWETITPTAADATQPKTK